MSAVDPRPLVAHVVYRFDVGGLENGVVNLINHFPEHEYRHAIISLTDITDFRERVAKKDVQFHALHKAAGHGFKVFPALYRLLRQIKPAIVHTRNLAALEMAVPAWAAGVPIRIHGEHGRDVSDPDGTVRKYQLIRKFYSPFISRYIALSKDLARYLTGPVGIAAERVAQVYNGVNTFRFFPPIAGRQPIAGCPFVDTHLFVMGTVGRMQTIKDQSMLARAFVRALELEPAARARLRLVMIGDGPQLALVRQILQDAHALDLAWLPGQRDDIPDVLRGLDCFVLPSLAEGISNTILEAMASGLPVLATDVGGNGELIVSGETGALVAASDHQALAEHLLQLSAQPEQVRLMGKAGRARVESLFSIDSMVQAYKQVYDQALALQGISKPVSF